MGVVGFLKVLGVLLRWGYGNPWLVSALATAKRWTERRRTRLIAAGKRKPVGPVLRLVWTIAGGALAVAATGATARHLSDLLSDLGKHLKPPGRPPVGPTNWYSALIIPLLRLTGARAAAQTTPFLFGLTLVRR